MVRTILIIIFTLFASPALVQGQIELVNNFQRPGGDYANFKETSARECARKCEIASRCQAFDFHKSDSSCWLKERVYQSRQYQGVVSGVKSSRYFKKTSEIAVNMDLSFDTQRPGGDYFQFHTENVQLCADRCVQDPQCVAFDYTTYGSLCYLKSWEPPARQYTGIISGVKSLGAPAGKYEGTVYAVKRQESGIKKNQYSDQVESVQRLLTQQSYNPGPVDGIMGRKTEIALENYQRDRALPVTGLIDRTTLIALGLQQPSSPKLSTNAGRKQVEFNSEQTTPEPPVSYPQAVNVAIFPWDLNGDASSLIGILKENINSRIEELDKLRLTKSYYKIKHIPTLNVSSSSNFYSLRQPNIPLVKQVGTEQNIDLAILGTMDIHCKWADHCQVREMEIMLFDLTTGEITSQKGSSWDVEARDLIDSTLLQVLSTFNKKMNDS